jgi:hypothetical protein
MNFHIIALLVVFTLSSFAGPCDQFFVSSEQYINKISKSFAKELPEDTIKLVNALNIDNRANLASYVEKLDSVTKKRLYKTISDEPEIFLRGEVASFNRIYIESIVPGFARKAHVNFQNFSPSDFKSTFKIPKFNTDIVATPVEKQYRKAFKSVNEFFDEQGNVFKYMQEFEEEILARSLKKDQNFYNLDERAQASIKQEKMIEVMDELEEANGFISADATKYKALDLENKGYSLVEWQEMLREGKLFNDTAFKNVENAIDLSSRTGHGYFTHRIQWHVLMKEMSKNPSRFQGISAVDLYKKLGDTEFANKMGLATNGGNTLWQHLFDATSGPSYHRPEHFRTKHDLYPFLGAWL